MLALTDWQFDTQHGADEVRLGSMRDVARSIARICEVGEDA
jgi:hypothetical protein